MLFVIAFRIQNSINNIKQEIHEATVTNTTVQEITVTECVRRLIMMAYQNIGVTESKG